MGLPTIIIDFKSRSVSAISRSQKGKALLLFLQSTGSDAYAEYKDFSQVDSDDYSSSQLLAIKLCIEQSVKSVGVLKFTKGSTQYDFEALEQVLMGKDFNYLCVCSEDYGGSDLKSFVTKARAKGRYIKAVCSDDYDYNHEGIINIAPCTFYHLESTSEQSQNFLVPIIGGIFCALPLGESGTYKMVNGVYDYLCQHDDDEQIDDGKIVLIKDENGYKIARGINTLTQYDSTHSSEMSKIKIMEAMDTIQNDIRLALEKSYIGKVKNDYDSKLLLCGAIEGYFNGLGENVIDTSYKNQVSISLEMQKNYLQSKGIDTDDMSEIEILKANTGSYVFLKGSVRFVDSMEDIVFNIEL